MFASPGVAIEIPFTLWCTVRTRPFLCLCFAEEMSRHVLNLRFCHFLGKYFSPSLHTEHFMYEVSANYSRPS